MSETKPRKKLQVYNVSGHAHELTFSVFRRQKKMFAPGVVETFLGCLARAAVDQEFDLWAYVVMPEHVHLLLYPRNEAYSMSEIRKAIKQPSAEAIFELHPEWQKKMIVKKKRRDEHRFWQEGGGYDRNMFTPSVIQSAIEYIHNNPVRRGLVDSATDWPWSSARAYHEGPSDIPVVLYSWLI